MNEIPTEISGYFGAKAFENYPKIEIPQSFQDTRGEILNIADGELGDVAVIRSKAKAIRANHVHISDWHLSYCLSGSLNYSFMPLGEEVVTLTIESGDLFFTPKQTPHRMDFLEDTVLLVISRNSRKRDKYQEDTKKFFLDI